MPFAFGFIQRRGGERRRERRGGFLLDIFLVEKRDGGGILIKGRIDKYFFFIHKGRRWILKINLLLYLIIINFTLKKLNFKIQIDTS